jgi:hypothetical protein
MTKATTKPAAKTPSWKVKQEQRRVIVARALRALTAGPITDAAISILHWITSHEQGGGYDLRELQEMNRAAYNSGAIGAEAAEAIIWYIDHLINNA